MERYLIKEVIDKPKNLENRAYYYALDMACKALNDKLSDVENSKEEYLDFLDSFIHEVKTPISALSLYTDKMLPKTYSKLQCYSITRDKLLIMNKEMVKVLHLINLFLNNKD